ncbi:DUF523 domain-containing protein [Roseibaca sp. Y0-43]|uniref:DUF523 domain-containing protein n=1 Tax=Roseibaca sp. Y0-43 TaxID=2816854 RepID=UPI001D0C894C|nr:DUF523 domain-containing protein [Roseibaca sp. Y0-43]MCC1480334.1 DUF523 domain-containing protein [Roseibaca sp. Y0-43]
MERILVSACLLGQPVRYDGRAKPSGADAILQRWTAEGRIVPICPELAAGLPTPRPAAEITDTGGGAMVLSGLARVMDATGADVTQAFQSAAQLTAALAARHGCRHAVLTDGSPSCGSGFIYDGTFSGTRVAGQGTTTAALRAAGVTVWSERDVAALDAILAQDRV